MKLALNLLVLSIILSYCASAYLISGKATPGSEINVQGQTGSNQTIAASSGEFIVILAGNAGEPIILTDGKTTIQTQLKDSRINFPKNSPSGYAVFGETKMMFNKTAFFPLAGLIFIILTCVFIYVIGNKR